MSDREDSIVNSVMTAAFNVDRVDLDEVDATLPHVKFEPDEFMGAILKINGTTIMLFGNGKMTLTGRTSITSKKRSLSEFVRALNECGIGGKIMVKRGSIQIENIVSEVDVGHPVDIEMMVKTLPHSATYEPEQFPALTWERPDCVAQVFGSGKVIVLGVKSEESLGMIQDAILNDLKEFIIEGGEKSERGNSRP